MENRKKEHIDLAFKSQVPATETDNRFYYEPMLSGHRKIPLKPIGFLGKSMNIPVWVSSMTGGTKLASKINHNIAAVCKDFGMGMGLGSCRIILDDDTYMNDFDVRKVIGDDLPLFINLGIAQIEELLATNKLAKITALMERLQADGLVVHVNPVQEWFQPEGDVIKNPPIDSVKRLLDLGNFKLIVKEVGQGMGIESLRQLIKLPLAAIEFAAFGGSNFAMLELTRKGEEEYDMLIPLTRIGHTAIDMVEMVNTLVDQESDIQCKGIIVSGGIKSFLDGFYLINKIKLPAVYGQASSILKYAKEGYDELYQHVNLQVKGLELAYSYLRIRT